MSEREETIARAEGTLLARLDAVLDRARWASRSRRVGDRLAALPIALLAIVTLDALVELPPVALTLASGVLAALLLRVCTGFVPERGVRRAGPAWAARRLEESSGRSDNAIVTALQMRAIANPALRLDGAAHRPAIDEPEEADIRVDLARRALRRGARAAESASVADAVSFAPARKAWLKTALVLTAFCVAAALEPRLLRFGLPRLLDPFAGRAPFTRTDFDLSVEPQAPLAGDDVVITVRAACADPQRLDLVLLGEDGAERERVPMRAAPARQDAPAYEATLRGLTEPVALHAAGATGRTDRVMITPILRPRLRSGSLTITPPEYTGWPQTTLRLSSAGRVEPGVRALVGSTGELRVTTTLPLADSNVDVQVEGVSARRAVRLDRPGEVEVTLAPESAAGLTMTPIARAVIRVDADAPPRATLVLPAREGERVALLEGASAPVRVEARDDVRIAALEMRWIARGPDGGTIAQGREALRPEGEAATASWTGAGAIDSAALGLRAGDRVRVRAVALDNRSTEFGGAQAGDSGEVEIVIVDRAGLEQARAGLARERASNGEAPGAAGSVDEPDRSGAGETEAGEQESGGEPGEGSGAGSARGEQPDDAPTGEQHAQAGGGGERGPGDRAGFARAFGDDDAFPSSEPQTHAGIESGSVSERADAAKRTASSGGDSAQTPGTRTRAAPAPNMDPAPFAPLAGSLADVPPAYREAAARYFRRIAEEDAAARKGAGGP